MSGYIDCACPDCFHAYPVDSQGGRCYVGCMEERRMNESLERRYVSPRHHCLGRGFTMEWA